MYRGLHLNSKKLPVENFRQFFVLENTRKKRVEREKKM